MRRFTRAISLALLLVLLLSIPALAAISYRAPFTVIEGDGNAYTMLPVIEEVDNVFLHNNDFMKATALDTRIETLGGSVRPHMVADNKTLSAMVVAANSQTNLYFTTNNADLSAMDIVAGDSGYVTIDDAAALEPGNNFEFETDGYVDTSNTDFQHIVHKRSAVGISVTDTQEVTGIIYYDDPFEIVPGGFAAWTDIDVTAYVPAYATGVVVHLTATVNGKTMGVRMNGSGDALASLVERHGWTIVGIDAADIFEVWFTDATCHLWIAGFTGEDFTFKAAADDVSLAAALAWTDIDISVEAPNATGAIIVVDNTDVVNARQWGIRMNGSADARFFDAEVGNINWGIIGLDNSQIFEGYVETLDVDFYLVGYTTGNVTFFTNGVDKSLAAGFGAWTDVDCSAETSAQTTHLIIELESPTGNAMGFRRNGSAENLAYVVNTHLFAVVECDENQIVEGWAGNANDDWWLIGYIEGKIDAPYELSISAAAVTAGEHVINVYATGGGTNLLGIDIDSGTITANVALAGASVPDISLNWELFNTTETPSAAYYDYYYHTVGGTLIARYEPVTIIANTGYDGTADAGGSTTTIVDAELTQANDYWNLSLLTITDTTDDLAPKGETSVITNFDAATDTLLFEALTAGIDAGDTYTVEFGTLLDREGAAQDGRITWGVNPSGVIVTMGSMVSAGQPIPGVGVEEASRDVLPEVAVSEWYTDPDVSGTLQTNPVRPFVTIMSDTTTLSETLAWRVLAAAAILLATVATGVFVGSLWITSMVAGVGVLACVILTIFPLWVLFIVIIFLVGGLVMERSPSF